MRWYYRNLRRISIIENSYWILSEFGFNTEVLFIASRVEIEAKNWRRDCWALFEFSRNSPYLLVDINQNIIILLGGSME